MSVLNRIFNRVEYDYVGVAWNAGTFTEVFTLKVDGASGTTKAVVTIVYTDATKEQLASVTLSAS